MQLEETYIAEIIKLQEYIDSKKNPLIQIVRLYQYTTNSAMLHTARSLRRELQRGTRQMKDSTTQNTKEGWRGKRMHVQFLYKLDKKLVDNEWSYHWLKFGDVKGETESRSGSSITNN
jgi:hypothetical protein